jgi:hypothetical protein
MADSATATYACTSSSRGAAKGPQLGGCPRADAMRAMNDIVFTANLPSDQARACLAELSLVAAIFEDAVHCARRSSGTVTHHASSEAAEWIASDRSDWPFAFVNVCDFLGVDAGVVRKRLEIKGRG